MSGVLYLGDIVEVPYMTVLWPYDESGGEPLPQARVMRFDSVGVQVKWVDRIPRGHYEDSWFRYDELRAIHLRCQHEATEMWGCIPRCLECGIKVTERT